MNSWFKRVQSSKQEPAVKEEGATQEAEGGPPQGASIRPGIGGGGGIGGFFANVATKIITTLAEEKERFMQETDHDDDEGNHLQGKDEHVTPLWLALAYHVDVEVGGGSDGAGDLSVIEEARNAILNLTKSKRNFLNAPPEDASFTFDYQTCLAQAQAAVNADPKLNMARFYLVPTYIKEEEFWRNWFYRVQIILTAYGLEMPKGNAKKGSNDSTQPGATASITSITSTTSTTSTNSTIPHSPELSVEDSLSRKIEKELGELGIHNSESNPDAWEEELKRELSSLDPSKEASADSLLSQNWEEELMLELGLKNSPNHKDNTGKLPAQHTSNLAPSSTNASVVHAQLANQRVETPTLSDLATAKPNATIPTSSSTTPTGVALNNDTDHSVDPPSTSIVPSVPDGTTTTPTDTPHCTTSTASMEFMPSTISTSSTTSTDTIPS